MLKTALFLSIMLFPLIGMSQFNYAIKLGYATSISGSQLIRYDDFEDYVIYNITHKKIALTPNINISGSYIDKQSNLFIQGDISYRQEHHVFEVVSDILTDIRTFDIKKIHRFINIPIIGGYTSDHFKFGIGPQISFLVSDNKVFEELLYFEEKRRLIETAFVVQLGYIYDDFFIELNYEYHNNGAVDQLLYQDSPKGFDNIPKYLNLNVGWYFSRYR